MRLALYFINLDQHATNMRPAAFNNPSIGDLLLPDQNRSDNFDNQCAAIPLTAKREIWTPFPLTKTTGLCLDHSYFGSCCC
jgi:hypothetical protein